jgi:hypothetical protein
MIHEVADKRQLYHFSLTGTTKKPSSTQIINILIQMGIDVRHIVGIAFYVIGESEIRNVTISRNRQNWQQDSTPVISISDPMTAAIMWSNKRTISRALQGIAAKNNVQIAIGMIGSKPRKLKHDEDKTIGIPEQLVGFGEISWKFRKVVAITREVIMEYDHKNEEEGNEGMDNIWYEIRQAPDSEGPSVERERTRNEEYGRDSNSSNRSNSTSHRESRSRTRQQDRGTTGYEPMRDQEYNTDRRESPEPRSNQRSKSRSSNRSNSTSNRDRRGGDTDGATKRKESPKRGRDGARNTAESMRATHRTKSEIIQGTISELMESYNLEQVAHMLIAAGEQINITIQQQQYTTVERKKKRREVTPGKEGRTPNPKTVEEEEMSNRYQGLEAGNEERGEAEGIRTGSDEDNSVRHTRKSSRTKTAITDEEEEGIDEQRLEDYGQGKENERVDAEDHDQEEHEEHIVLNDSNRKGSKRKKVSGAARQNEDDTSDSEYSSNDEDLVYKNAYRQWEEETMALSTQSYGESRTYGQEEESCNQERGTSRMGSQHTYEEESDESTHSKELEEGTNGRSQQVTTQDEGEEQDDVRDQVAGERSTSSKMVEQVGRMTIIGDDNLSDPSGISVGDWSSGTNSSQVKTPPTPYMRMMKAMTRNRAPQTLPSENIVEEGDARSDA